MKKNFTHLAAIGILGSAMLGCAHTGNMSDSTHTQESDILPKSTETDPPAMPYVTQYSTLLKQFETSANNNALTDQKIAILDRDEAARYIINHGPGFVHYGIFNQLEPHGIVPTLAQTSSMSHTMGSYTIWANANAMVFGEEHARDGELDSASTQTNACIIIPETSDLYSLVAVHGYIDKQDIVRKDIHFPLDSITKRTTYHEIWHCRDTKFLPLIPRDGKEREKDPLGTAHSLHKAELFADVASALDMYAGGNTKITRLWADMRTIRADRQGTYFAKADNPKVDPSYYSAGTRFHTAGLEKVIEHVEQVGLPTVSQYTTADIQRIAEEITEQTALTRQNLVTMSGYLKNGEIYLATLKSTERNFINKYKKRLRQAEDRILTTNPAEGISRLSLISSFYNYIKQAPADIAQEVKDQLESTAKEMGNTADAYLSLMDQWRTELHNAPDYQPRLQTKIITLDALLHSGYVTERAKLQKQPQKLVTTKPPEKPAL